ncbi:MAG: iron-containing redox enzyme family protein, partial [Planctomycetota bacterium]
MNVDRSVLVPSADPTRSAGAARAPWLAELQRDVESSAAVRHPLLERAGRGELSREQFARFGRQHQALVGVFTRYLELLLLATDDSSQKLWLAKILIDEYGEGSEGKDHAELYAGFLERLGVDERARLDTPLVPEVWRFVGGHLALCREQPFLAGLGALGPGHEWAIPSMFERMVRGLGAAGVTLEERLYFDLHTEQDQDHGKWMTEAMAKLVVDGATRDLVRAGAMRSLALRAELWSAIERVVDGADPVKGSPGTLRDLRAAVAATLHGAEWPVDLAPNS